jgi:hypothetical protein
MNPLNRITRPFAETSSPRTGQFKYFDAAWFPAIAIMVYGRSKETAGQPGLQAS